MKLLKLMVLLGCISILSCNSRSSMIAAAKSVEPPIVYQKYQEIDSVYSIMYEYRLDSTDIRYTLSVRGKLMPKAYVSHYEFSIRQYGNSDKELLAYLLFQYNEEYLIPFEFN